MEVRIGFGTDQLQKAAKQISFQQIVSVILFRNTVYRFVCFFSFFQFIKYDITEIFVFHFVRML